MSYGEIQPDGGYSVQGLWHLNDNSSPESDSSGNGNSGTVIGATYVETGRFGGGYNFDGDGDYISIDDDPVFNIATTLTVTAWVKFDTLLEADRYDCIIGKYLRTGDEREWLISTGYAISDYNRIEVTYGNPADGTFLGAATTVPTVTVDQWYLIVFTFNSGADAIYINGESVALSDSGTIPSSLYNGTANIEIGGSSRGVSDTIEGTIDDVAIYSRVLSASEIRYLYAQTKGAYGIK